jgi:glycosyltransferase involved in cell wall biosynthesis
LAKILIAGGVPGSLINFRGDLIKEWVNKGHQVVAVSAPASEKLKKKLAKMNVKFIAVPLERDKTNPFGDLRLLYKIYQIIRLERPAIIFAYTIKPVIYTSLVARLFPDIKVYSLITGIGFALSDEISNKRNLRWILCSLYRLSLRRSNMVIFQNPDDRLLFKRLDFLMDTQKTYLVNGSGVNLDHYYFSAPKQADQVSFLFIGRLIRSKGIAEYARAAEIIKKRHDNVSFRLLGSLTGSSDLISKEDLARWISEGTIEYCGRVDDVRPFIVTASVVVLPSFYGEGTPRSILEAMSMGRPVITTDAPGCRETVVDGINGYLIPVKDSTALATAMEKFILNPELVGKMGIESRKIAEAKYDVRKVNRVILEAMDLGDK